MAKPKHTMVPRRGAVLLALLASASNQTLLAALTVGSLNTAMVSSASAATCVTSVSPTFANVVSGVSGAPGITVVSAVTPTFSNAVTGVTAPTQTVVTGVTAPTEPNFLTSGTTVTTTAAPALTSVTTTPGNAIAFGSLPTGTVTGLTPGSSDPNLRTIAFNITSPGAANAFYGANNSNVANNPPSNLQMLGNNANLPILTVPFLNGTTTNTNVVTGQGTSLGVVTNVTGNSGGPFLTTAALAPVTGTAVTSVTPITGTGVSQCDCAHWFIRQRS